jgi:hypothetical protein
MARQQIKTSVRFEVFKRDSFTCQYCGAKSPDVILEVDHIKPVAGGGTNDILNLVTACRQCNAGKKDRLLSDDAAVKKARAQADELEERRRQLEMIAEWHRGLINTDHEAVVMLERLWLDAVEETDESVCLTDKAKETLRTAMRRYGFELVCQAISQVTTALRKVPKQDRSLEDRNQAFWSIPSRCTVLKADRDNPGIGRLFYIRGILRKRCAYMSENACIALLKEAWSCEIEVDWMESIAKQATSWSWFRDLVSEQICQVYDSQEADDGTNP